MVTKEEKKPLLKIADLMAVVLLFSGLALLVAYGSSPDLVYALPGYCLILMSGAFAIPSVFFATQRVAMGPVIAVTGALTYFVWRAFASPVSYFAREDILLIFAGWIAMVVVWGVLGSRGWGKAVLWCVAILGLVNGIAAGLQYGGYRELVELPMMHLATYRERSGGFFGNPNHGAAMGGIGVLAWGAIALFSRSGAALKMVAAFGGVICALAMLLAKSRGGVLGLAAGITVMLILALVMFLRHSGRRNWKLGALVSVGILVAILGIGALGSDVIGTRFKQKLTKASKGDVREHIWKSAILQFSDEPVLGTGSRTFTDYCWKYRMPEMHPSTREAEFVHSEHLQVMAEYGLVGLGLAWGIGGVVLWVGGRKILGSVGKVESRSDDVAGVVFGLSAVAAMAVQGIAEFQMHVPAIFVTVGAGIGLVFSKIENGKAVWRTIGLIIPITLAGVVASGAWMLPKYSAGAWSYVKGMEVKRKVGTDSLTAARLFDRASKADSGLLPAFEELGNSRVALADGIFSGDPTAKRQMLEQALEAYKGALEIRPDSVPILSETGKVLDKLDRADEAEGYFIKAVEWAPLYGSVRNALAMHYFRRGNWGRAREVFEESMKTRVAHERSFTMKMLRTLDALEKTNP